LGECFCFRFRWSTGCSFWIDRPQFRKEDFVIRLIIDIMNIDVADDSFFVEDEERPFGVPLRSKDTILLRYFAMRPEIAQ
jgi:hypothetical protein